jgi:hypothetical protein
MQESHKRTIPVLDFKRLHKSLASAGTPVSSFGHTNGASQMVLQASGQFTSVDHPVGQVELARRSGIPGGDSNVETSKSGCRLHSPSG